MHPTAVILLGWLMLHLKGVPILCFFNLKKEKKQKKQNLFFLSPSNTSLAKQWQSTFFYKVFKLQNITCFTQ